MLASIEAFKSRDLAPKMGLPVQQLHLKALSTISECRRWQVIQIKKAHGQISFFSLNRIYYALDNQQATIQTMGFLL
jgi:hypothetical protein